MAFVFAVETFFKTGEFIIATQSAFRAHFMFDRKDAISDRIFNLY